MHLHRLHILATVLYVITQLGLAIEEPRKRTKSRPFTLPPPPPPGGFPHPASLIPGAGLGLGNPFGHFMPLTVSPLGLNSLYPGMGAIGGGPLPFNGGLNVGLPGTSPNLFNPFLPGRKKKEEIYTAIAKHPLDENSQMRLTITERSTFTPGTIEALHENVLDELAVDDFDEPQTWYVQGTFLNGNINMAGTYTVVVTTGGRTADGCDGQSLGRIITSPIDPANPFPGFDPFQGPFGGPTAAGILQDKLLIGAGGPTVYSSTLSGVSKRQLAGAGLAACQFIQNGYCSGAIPFCATIAKDNLPAMEVPLIANRNPLSGFNTVNLFNPGSMVLGLGSGPAGGQNGLFTSGLAFSDSIASSRDDSLSRDDNDIGFII